MKLSLLCLLFTLTLIAGDIETDNSIETRAESDDNADEALANVESEDGLDDQEEGYMQSVVQGLIRTRKQSPAGKTDIQKAQKCCIRCSKKRCKKGRYNEGRCYLYSHVCCHKCFKRQGLHKACKKDAAKPSKGVDGLCADIKKHDTEDSGRLTVHGSKCDRTCGGEQYHCKFEMWFKSAWIKKCNDTSKSCFGDGHERKVTIVTDDPKKPMLPGPSIIVCEGDIVSFTMHNGLETSSASLHWHGLHMVPNPVNSLNSTQGEGTQWADGVPYITQCPTAPGDTFNYIFFAAPSGTYWYHSHNAFQADDGSFGALIVRENPLGPTREQLPQSINTLIDESCDISDNTIQVTDWYDYTARWRHASGWQPPRNILINGKGRSYKENPGQKIDSDTPWNVFTVNKAKNNCLDKKYYRFRVIGTQSLNCKIQISIEQNVDDHMNLTVIATDGQYVEPRNVTSFIISNGERYDILIPADAPIANQGVYTMRFGGYGGCGYFKYSALAFIQYDESQNIDQGTNPDYEKATNIPGPTLNGFSGNDISAINLKSAFPFEYNGPADKTFYMQFTPSPHGFAPTLINNVAFQPGVMQKPLLSQDHQLDSSNYCSPEIAQGGFKIDKANINHTCYHILEIDLGDVVDLFLINPGQSRHPIHMHGYHFRAIAEGKLDNPNPNVNYVPGLQKLNNDGSISRNYDHPVKKDTFQAKMGGWQLIRFHANNPGYWFTHCHNMFHHIDGMAFVIKVGNREDWNIPNDFPTCGDSQTCPRY